MKKLLLTASCSIVLLLGACGSDEENASNEGGGAEQTATTADGEAVYRSASCFSCHGADLEGASGPSLETVGARLTNDEIRSTIENGTDVMPSGLVEDPAELDALVEWLASQE